MKTPEMQVADYLTNDERLVTMMDELRQDKLSYVPILLVRLMIHLLKRVQHRGFGLLPYLGMMRFIVTMLAFLNTHVYKLIFGFVKRMMTG